MSTPSQENFINVHLEINKQSKGESMTQQVQGLIKHSSIRIRPFSASTLIITQMSTYEDMKWMLKINGMDCTHAYTGIASESPVGVHSSPHLDKNAGIHFPYEERFIRVSNIAHLGINGSYSTILELMVFLIHSRGRQKIMNAWNNLLNKHYHHFYSWIQHKRQNMNISFHTTQQLSQHAHINNHNAQTFRLTNYLPSALRRVSW